MVSDQNPEIHSGTKKVKMAKVKHALGNKDGEFVVSYKGKDENGKKVTKKVAFTGVYMMMPTDMESFEAFFEKYTVKVGNARTELKGVLAALAAKALHSSESIRGEARQKLEGGATPQAVGEWMRKTYAAYDGPTGAKGGFKKTEVSVNSLAEIMQIEDPAERLLKMTQYLAAQGAAVK